MGLTDKYDNQIFFGSKNSGENTTAVCERALKRMNGLIYKRLHIRAKCRKSKVRKDI
jgi:hypothetical protein